MSNDPYNISLAKLALAGTYKGLETRLKEVVHDWKSNDIQATGRFFYLSFQGGKPTLDEFVEYIYWRIVPFCIPRAERARKLALLNETQDMRYAHELTDKARNLFVKAINSQKTAGEPGELILFTLLEGFLGAPQIACKMHLKTNENVAVHGTDGIHVHWTNGEGLTFYWGESKIYAALPSALDSILDSIGDFVSAVDEHSPRDRDIEVLRDHTNIDDPQIKDALLEYFDPYSEKANQRKEVYACFVGFEFEKLATMQKMPEPALKKYFEDVFLEKIKSTCDLFSKKIKTKGLHELEFAFFLIPFSNVDEFRKAFFKKLGINNA